MKAIRAPAACRPFSRPLDAPDDRSSFDDVGSNFPRAAANSLRTHIVETRTRDAGRVERREKGRHAAGAGIVFIRAREHKNVIGLLGHRDRGFFPRQDVAVTVGARLRLQMRRVGAASRLRQTERDDRLARANPRNDFIGDFRSCMRGDDRSHQGAEKLDITDTNVAAGYFLDDNAGRDTIEARRTKLFGQIGTDQTELTHIPDKTALNYPGGFTRLVGRRESLAGKPPCSVSNGLLIRCIRKVQDATYFICLRNSGLRFSLSALTPSFDSAEL